MDERINGQHQNTLEKTRPYMNLMKQMKFFDSYMINSDTKRKLSETVFKLKGDLELGHKTLS